MASLEVIRDVISKEMNIAPELIEPGTHLIDLGIDSLMALTVLFQLEDRFNVEIPPDIVDTIITVDDILTKINELQNSSEHV
ncbi:MAG: acyl carrier protein [Gammaproteobacteria bacterium]|nr:acyl carrier protein [Gammaproteobacteria bacterium]